MSDLTHFDAEGRPTMVDVGNKPATNREAIATGAVRVNAEAMAILLGRVPSSKGDALRVAELAGIMAAKRTSDLIPLCHPLSLSKVAVTLDPDEATNRVQIRATVRTTGSTGVEMEAMTAVSIAALTLYDMLKAVDRGMTIEAIRLIHKAGGKSGSWNVS